MMAVRMMRLWTMVRVKGQDDGVRAEVLPCFASCRDDVANALIGVAAGKVAPGGGGADSSTSRLRRLDGMFEEGGR